jgi:predicted dithiol-disulfide oxidoreductase (DUF899 family)
MICVSRAPLEQLLAYRERMGWRFEWVSSHDSDFNLDFGVSAGGESLQEPLLEADELGALKRLADDPALRDRLPLVSNMNASATGTDLDGYFAEGHGFSTFAREGDSVYHYCYSTYARGTEFLMTTTRSSTTLRKAVTRATSRWAGSAATTSIRNGEFRRRTRS